MESPISWLPSCRLSEEKTSIVRDGLFVAYVYARDFATDPRTQNGSVITKDNAIVTHGWNSFPPNVRETNERWERPLKYAYVEHAERKAIYHAAQKGMSCDGAHMYCPWYACADCARAIIESGIRKVTGHLQMFVKTPEHWRESMQIAFEMLSDAGVETFVFDGKVCNRLEVRIDGEVWVP